MFHIPTLMICLSAAFVTVSIFLTLFWLSDRSNKALALWSAGFWTTCAGLFLLALRDIGPGFIGIGFGNAVCLCGLGLIWRGSLRFDGRTPRCGAITTTAGGVIWLLAFFFWPGFPEDLTLRIMLASILYSFYSLLIALVIWQGYRAEPLPARRFAILAFGSHGLFYLVRTGLPFIQPVTIVDGHATLWYGVLAFENFIQVLFATLAIFSMVHERMSLEYKRASELDFLTGLYNRRAFLAALRHDRERTGGAARGGVVALLDADHFKQINDTHGHGAGDAALRMLAQELGSQLPAGAHCGRLGGEEFGLYMSASIAAQWPTFLQDLVDHIRRQPFEFDGQHFYLTVSIGAALLPEGDIDFNLALAAADRALYSSKKAGRDCLTVTDFDTPASQNAPGAIRSLPVSA